MNFYSLTFVLFFAAVLLVLWLLKIPALDRLLRGKARGAGHLVLLLASYCFLWMADGLLASLLLLLSVITYLCARGAGGSRHPLFWTRLGVIAPLLMLAVFKYFNFFAASFESVFGGLSSLPSLVLPVGISFYTFSAISYVVDVHRKKYAPCTSFVRVAMFLSFFPKLLSGPIVRASEFLPQLEEDRTVSLKNLETGVQIFLFGLFKKVVLADHLSVFVGDVFGAPGAFGSLTVILAAVSYSLQIYLDFSGYSDMAIGLAKCMGYDITRNFNLPYLSRNVTEFWKRWHISLSSWLQDYLYIPLGGNRKGPVRTYLNLLITMLLGGLWHGASWTFMVWGGIQGIGLCAHKLFLRWRKGRHSRHSPLTTVLSVAGTFLFVTVSWVFFRAPDLNTAFAVLSRMVIWQGGVSQLYSWSFAAILLSVGATVVACRRSRRQPVYDKRTGCLQMNGFYLLFDLTKFWSLVLFFTILGLTIGLAYTGASPFIYGNF
jgi:alginate O-acetyltransferase complex protein AlgI